MSTWTHITRPRTKRTKIKSRKWRLRVKRNAGRGQVIPPARRARGFHLDKLQERESAHQPCGESYGDQRHAQHTAIKQTVVFGVHQAIDLCIKSAHTVLLVTFIRRVLEKTVSVTPCILSQHSVH